MKIIGYTVGTTLPKPNLKQTDPTKGDYVKGKEILDEKYIKVDEQELTDEQKAQVRTNVDAVSMAEAEALTDGVAYIDVEDNENVDVPDSDVSNIVVDSALSTSSANPVQNKVITEKINEITSDIEALNNSVENLPAGETVQSDWNQNDPNAPDYIKNRPFYSETKTVLEEQTIEGFENMGNGVHFVELSQALNLEECETYVTFDGVEYRTEVVSDYFGDMQFGNLHLFEPDMYPDTGEPFFMGVSPTGGMTAIGTTYTGTSHTVKIVQNVPKKIDKKYIPRMGDLVVNADRYYPTIFKIRNDTNGEYIETDRQGTVTVEEFNEACDFVNSIKREHGIFYEFAFGIRWQPSVHEAIDDYPKTLHISVDGFYPVNGTQLVRMRYTCEYRVENDTVLYFAETIIVE